MTFENAIEAAKVYLPEYMQETRGVQLVDGRNVSCPDPAHRDSTPSATYYREQEHLYCHGCGRAFDIFDIYAMDTGKSGREVYFDLFARYAIPCEDKPTRQRTITKAFDSYSRTAKKERPAPEDLTEYCRKCTEDSRGVDYLATRGISGETARAFRIGFDPAFRPDPGKSFSFPAVIIPNGPLRLIARNTGETGPRYCKRGPEGEGVAIYNAAVLSGAEPVIIVEGEIDAISFAEIGRPAVALGSTANRRKLVKLLEETPTAAPLIIALDADEAGRNAAKLLEQDLTAAGIACTVAPADLYGGTKDANEALCKDRDAFRKEADQAAAAAKDEIQEPYKREYCAARLIGLLKQEIRESAERPPISTGFSGLDKVFDGGLHQGLYVIGAISSLGKTSFALQLAEQIAGAAGKGRRTGADVLFISLEMSRLELIARGVSRQTFLLDPGPGNDYLTAKTTRGIMGGSRYKLYREEEQRTITKAFDAYARTAEHLYILEGQGETGAREIREAVDRHARITGRAPVVFVDYLQIMAPDNVHYTDKQNTDRAVTALKRISRDYNCPVIAISSFNRDNYMQPVNTAAFKESGAIEYSSDVLMALQYDGMDYETDGDRRESEKQHDARIRQLLEDNRIKSKGEQRDGALHAEPVRVQLKVLKNRNGPKDNTTFLFWPMFNAYEEDKSESVF